MKCNDSHLLWTEDEIRDNSLDFTNYFCWDIIDCPACRLELDNPAEGAD